MTASSSSACSFRTRATDSELPVQVSVEITAFLLRDLACDTTRRDVRRIPRLSPRPDSR